MIHGSVWLIAEFISMTCVWRVLNWARRSRSVMVATIDRSRF